MSERELFRGYLSPAKQNRTGQASYADHVAPSGPLLLQRSNRKNRFPAGNRNMNTIVFPADYDKYNRFHPRKFHSHSSMHRSWSCESRSTTRERRSVTLDSAVIPCMKFTTPHPPKSSQRFRSESPICIFDSPFLHHDSRAKHHSAKKPSAYLVAIGAERMPFGSSLECAQPKTIGYVPSYLVALQTTR